MWFWIIASIVAVVIGAAIWFAVQRLLSWQGIGDLAMLAWRAVAPGLLKRKPPEQEALDRASYRRGEDKTPGAHGHGGEH